MLEEQAIKDAKFDTRKNPEDWTPVQTDGNGKLLLPMIRYDNSSPIQDFKRVLRLFGNGRNDGQDGFDSALGSLKNRVVMSGQSEIVFDSNMHKKLFGDKNTGDRGEMDKYDREITTQMFGEGVMSDDALLHLGDKWFQGGIESHMFAKGIRDTWLEFEAIREKDSSKSIFGNEVNEISNLIDKAFSGGKGLSGKELPTGIVLTEGGKVINPNRKEQLFASDVLEVLKQQKERSVINESLVGPVTKRMEVAQISRIMEKFESFGILDGFKGNREQVEIFRDNLADYTRTKGLDMATRNDGMPLTAKDLAVLDILARTRLMGRNYDIAMITDQIGQLKDFFTRSDIITRHQLKPEDVKNIDKSLLEYLIERLLRVQKTKHICIACTTNKEDNVILDLANKYNVRSVPTTVIEENGIEIDRFVGATSKQAVLNRIS